MESYRRKIEQAIIGTCLLEGGYPKIADILSYRNFIVTSPFDHQKIFMAIEQMYPKRPIDLLTIAHAINENGYPHYLSDCASKVSSSAHLRSHAAILIELNMRDALVATLRSAGNTVGISTTTKSELSDIIDNCLDHSVDIIEIYSNTSKYLQGREVETIVSLDVNKLSVAFEGKIIKLRNQSSVDTLILNLEKYKGYGSDARSSLCLAKLVESIKGILASGPVDDITASRIMNL